MFRFTILREEKSKELEAKFFEMSDSVSSIILVSTEPPGNVFSHMSLNTLTRPLRRLLTDPAYFWLLASLVIIADALLTSLIIRFVPCQSLILCS